MIVFNDSYKSEGFEVGIEEANALLVDLGLKLEYNFIEDYVGIDGEYAYTLTIERHEEFKDDKQLDLL
jgi:hypothetical protein